MECGALYGEFYQELAECIKDQLLSLDCPKMFQQLNVDAFKCDTHYWEFQGKKAAPSGQNRQSASTSVPEKSGNNLTALFDYLQPVTQPWYRGRWQAHPEEWEYHHLKGL